MSFVCFYVYNSGIYFLWHTLYVVVNLKVLSDWNWLLEGFYNYGTTGIKNAIGSMFIIYTGLKG